MQRKSFCSGQRNRTLQESGEKELRWWTEEEEDEEEEEEEEGGGERDDTKIQRSIRQKRKQIKTRS